MKQKTKRVLQKYLSLLLIAAILLTTQGVLAQAETVTPDDAEKRQAETVTPDHAARRQTRGRELPSNPVHHCTKKDDGTDYTDWSYVYFGSYPQTEVTGDALTSDIIGAAYDENGDAWVNGRKYRRISKNDAKYDGFYFGDSEYRFFKWQRIKWRVLKNDGNTLFIMADKGLDCKYYHDDGGSITWENCSLRSWLNNTFYNLAFSNDEQSAIIKTDVINSVENPITHADAGNDTQDMIYLLSYNEASSSVYGFCNNARIQSVSRFVKVSEYAHILGQYAYTADAGEGNCDWWLRSRKRKNNCTASYGQFWGDISAETTVIGTGSITANKTTGAVVPALHITLSSDAWSLTDDGTSGEGSSGSGEENGDITETGNQAIIDRVSEYTSDELYALHQSILNSNCSEEAKYKVYQALFQDYGITDVHEGIRYLSNTTDKRRAYLALTTDDFYSAANYKHWLKNTAKGKAAQVVLLADGLIFNNEINDWLDFSTYLEKNYPGVAKYKAMLYDFMDASSDSIEIVSNIKLVSDLSGKVTGAAKLKADNLIEQLNRCSTAAEAEKIMDSSAAMEVWIELAEVKDKNGNFVRDDNGSIKLTYRLDESSGFGQFAKAMGYATKGISLVDMAVSDFMDFKALDDKLAVYMQYQRFLQDIVSDTDGLPYQMRWAASLILTELEESYFGEIKDVAWEVVEETKINDIVLEKMLGKIAVDNIKSWLNVIGMESFFVNKLADIGGMVKKEACVEGYADLASAFTKKLERSKQTFLAARTEENAWDFYYNYNILYRLRYKGEEAYLDMTKVEGFLSYFSDFGYSLKKDVVNETFKMLEDKCQFTMDEAAALPESCQFVAKSVISCPVNVSVYAENGTLITELVDGTQSDVTNEYGRFAVVYDSYSGDYEKVICLNSEENVSFKITGVDDGLVAMDFAQAKDAESMVYTFNNVPIKTDAAIYADVKQITEQKIYQIDESGNGELDERPIIVKSDNYVPVDSVVLSETVLKLKEGENAGLKVMINPSNATEQKISWMSANPSIAAITDGKVTAVTQGSTVIYGIAMDDRDKIVSCEVSVVADMGDIPVCEEHSWDDGIITKEPTCTERGEKTYTCVICGETKNEEIKATGHQTKEVRNKKDATCKAEGYSGDTYCKDCNKKLNTGQAIAATGKHTWDKGKESKASSCTEKGEKQYICSVCGETKKESLEKISHAYKTTVTKATTSENGSITEKCASCGIVKSSKTIPCVKSATLRTVSYTYNGKAKKPSVTIEDSSGKVVSAHNYTVKYKNNKKIGKASVTIKLQGNYTGTIKKTLKLFPKERLYQERLWHNRKGLL